MSTALNNIDLNALLPYLISGGGGALAGAMVAGRRKEKSGEGRLGYLGRILRNSLVAGAAAGGGHYLVNKGLQNLTSTAASGPSQVSVEKALGLDPSSNSNLVTGFARDNLVDGWGGNAVGAGAFLATKKVFDSPFLGSGAKQRAGILKDIAQKLDKSEDALRDMDVRALNNRRRAYNKSIAQAAQSSDGVSIGEDISGKSWRRAGLGSDKYKPGGLFDKLTKALKIKETDARAIKGNISKYSRGPFVSNTLGLGSTRPQQLVRGAAALAMILGAPRVFDKMLPKPDISE